MYAIAIIPCRMGSKRLPRKNTLTIEPGTTLVQHAIDCANHAGVFRHVYVLTDDPGLHFFNATYLSEPSDMAADSADISAAVAEATERIERSIGRVDYVATLQPAVVARSALIVRNLVLEVGGRLYGGGVTAARTVPWQWSTRDGVAANGWHPRPYPRSDSGEVHFAEINAVQVASRAAVAAGQRWRLPLVLAELPEWAAALDIDDGDDLARARDLWPWAKPRLETWEPTLYPVNQINGSAA